MRRSLCALGLLVLGGGCASTYTAAQWRAHDAFQGCLQSLGAQVGQSFVSFDATKDGTLYYGPFRQPAAEAKFAECLRTRYPDVNAIAGARPR